MTSLRRTCLSGALVLLSLATATAGAAAPPDAGTRPDAGPTEPEADGGESSEDGGAERVDGSEFRPFSGEADRDPPSREAIDALGDRIDAILEENVEPSANVGIAAVDATTGTVLYERNPELPQNPASNMKLVTSAAALDHFGPDHTFETRLSIVRDRRDEDRLKGPLYLSSTGAPFVLFEDVLRWAAAVRRAGVETLEKGIVVDDSAFADAYLPPGFGQKDEDASYRAPVGAVSVSFNAVQVTVTPPDEGMADPTIEMSPPNDYVDLEKHVRTLPGDGQSVSFSSEPIDGRRTRIRVAGAIGADSEPVSERLRIDYPSRFAGSVLERALEMVGVTVEGDVRRGEVPSGAQALHTDTSHPLSYAILAMNKWSNNFMAEQLLRTLGRGEEGAPATWERARGRVRQFLVSAGLATDEFELHNGSGLYEGNAISARNVVRLLVSMSDHRWAPEYLASLSIAGRDGTLKERMQDTAAADRLRGKTGTLNDVSALSGWVRTQSGRRVAFSILLDETPEKGWRYRPVLDAIAVELAEFDG